MPAPDPVLWLDYVDPASFLAERRVAGAEAASGVSVERRPLELRPPPRPLIDPDDAAWRAHWDEFAAVARGEGLELRRPGLVPWTRKAHELAMQAGVVGVFAEVHASLFHAFLVEGKDIGRVDVLAEIARAHGMPWTETRAVLDVDKHAEAVAGAREAAERLGIRGVPTLRAGDDSLEGLHEPGTILAFLERRRP